MLKFKVKIARQHIEQANPQQAGDAIAIALAEFGFEHVEMVHGSIVIGNNPQDSVTYKNDEVLCYWVTASHNSPHRIHPITIEFCETAGGVAYTQTWLSHLALLNFVTL